MGEMERVIVVDNGERRGRVDGGDGKEMDGLVVDGDEGCERWGVLGGYIVGMELGREGGKGGIVEMKIMGGVIMLEVGIEWEKRGERDEKEEMKIGKGSGGLMEGENGMVEIRE